jgi:hypothetical protein
MLIHAFPKSSSPQDSSRFDATRVNSRGTPCLVRLDRVFARSLRACATARQSSLLVGVRSVGAGPCLAVGTTTDLFFAGFAATSEVASTHSEPKAARRWSVFAKRESCGTFVTLKSGRFGTFNFLFPTLTLLCQTSTPSARPIGISRTAGQSAQA